MAKKYNPFASKVMDPVTSTTYEGISLDHYKDYIAPGEGNYIQGDVDTDRWDEERAQKQGSLAKIGNTIGQGAGTFLTATASSLAAVGGAATALGAEIATGGEAEGMDIMLNNPVMQGINTLDKAIKEDFLPTYYTKEQQASILSAATATDGINGLGFLLSAILPGAAVTKSLGGLSKIGQMAKLGKLEEVASKAVRMGTMKADEAAKLVTFGKYMKEIPAVTGAIVGRLGESAMEANGTYEDLKGSLTAERDKARYDLENYGETDNPDLVNLSDDEIEKRAKSGRDNVFYGNMALAASDLAQFTRWFKPNAYERVVRDGLGYAVKKEGTKELIGGAIKESLQEAGEEGLQYMLGEGARKDARDNGDNFISNTLGSVGDAFTTIEGQKSMLLGAILGGGAGATFKAMNKKDINAQLNEGVALNNANPSYSNNKYIVNVEGKKVINPEFIKNNAQQANFEAQKQKAIESGDTETAELIEKLQFASMVNSRVQTNTFNDLIEDLEQLGEADDVEMEQYFGQVPTDAHGNPMSAKQISQQKIAEAKELKATIEGINMVPQFQGLSPKGKGILAQNLITQDALNKQIKATTAKMASIVPQRDWETNLEGDSKEGNINYKGLNPLQRESLKKLESTKNDLINEYNRINSALESYTAKPEKIEKIVEEQTKKEEVAAEAMIEKEVKKDDDADAKLNKLKQDSIEGPVAVSTPQGDIFVRNVNGNLIDVESGDPINEASLKQDLKGDITEDEKIDEPEIEEGEVMERGPKKPTVFHTSTRGHAQEKGGKPYSDFANANPETGEIKYTLYLPHYEATKYLSSPTNTPSKTNHFTFTLELVTPTEIQLEEINKSRKSRQLDPLTMEDLNKPEYRIIKMTMHNKEESIEGMHLHDIDYFYETAEYERLMADMAEGKISDFDIVAARQKIVDFRIKIVADLEQGKPVKLQGITKSDGMPNFNPNVEGKKQVLPIQDSLGTIAPEGKSEANGIGVVTSVDEEGVVTVEFENGVKKSGKWTKISQVGAVVFETTSANGSPYVVDGITFRNYTSEQLDSIVKMIMYRFTTGSNTLTKGSKSFTLFGNSTQRGLIDTLLYIGKREAAREKQLFIAKDSGSLWIGRKEFKSGSNPQQVEQALNSHIQAHMSRAKFTLGSIRNKTELVFPQEIAEDGAIDTEVKQAEEVLFSSNQPLIGTNVNSEIRFINSYIGYEVDTNGEAKIDEPVKEAKPVEFTENLSAESTQPAPSIEATEVITPVDPELDEKLEEKNKDCNSSSVLESKGPVVKSKEGNKITKIKFKK